MANNSASTLATAPTRRPTPLPSPRLDSPVSFRLDSDIRLACEDQAQAQGMEFDLWLQQTLNEALHGYLGI